MLFQKIVKKRKNTAKYLYANNQEFQISKKILLFYCHYCKCNLRLKKNLDSYILVTHNQKLYNIIITHANHTVQKNVGDYKCDLYDFKTTTNILF